jgi:membrane protein
MTAATEDGEGGVHRLRALATRIVGRVGGLPAVRTLSAVLTTYDRAGGGLMAAGLAYAAVIALLPGLLLLVSIFGAITSDETTRERIVSLIATAVPPLEGFARTAFLQVSAAAVPTGAIGVVGLLWGASRFYAALDYGFARIFDGGRRRNELERTLRGLALTGLLVLAPLAALLVGSLAGWLVELSPGLAGTPWQIATPLGSVVLFVVATILVYRYVPAAQLARAALLRPAILVGLVLAAIAQLFAFVAPFLTRIAAVFGPFVAVFALLAWLSLSFNVLLLGACWVHDRALGIANGATRVAAGDA